MFGGLTAFPNRTLLGQPEPPDCFAHYAGRAHGKMTGATSRRQAFLASTLKLTIPVTLTELLRESRADQSDNQSEGTKQAAHDNTFRCITLKAYPIKHDK